MTSSERKSLFIAVLISISISLLLNSYAPGLFGHLGGFPIGALVFPLWYLWLGVARRDRR